MKRAEIFGLLIAADLLAAVAIVAVYVSAGSSHGGFYGWMMGQMGSGAGAGASGAPGGAWVAVVALAAVGVVAVAGLGYALAYPEIKPTGLSPAPTPQPGAGSKEMSWDFLVRTSKEDERKVLGVLAAHGGGYLQKFVVKESGLSKLKTHRIVARLAERGVVTVQKSGNTNQVSLAPWVRGAPPPKGAGSEAGMVSSVA